eukprot:COSAG05_NODE_560_length_8675_cov_18.684235_4_plen_59_part_00
MHGMRRRTSVAHFVANPPSPITKICRCILQIGVETVVVATVGALRQYMQSQQRVMLQM